MTLASDESTMWDLPTPRINSKASDAEINARYETRERKIVVEANREKLPNFVAALDRPGYMNIRPFYQRRLRWDQRRQSRFIESFIINIPVPPLFLYEENYNAYEVIDGQQRISAIKSFYSNDLVLKGLEHWPELNGRKYSNLPENIRAGIDRRSISYFVVLTESAQSTEEALLLKQIVFERLNTGGVKLSNQEIRNSLYHGPFNAMLFELARNKTFRAAIDLPPPTNNEAAQPAPALLSSSAFRRMDDIEMVLRFFALRHHDRFQRGMQGFLDLYMIRSREFSAASLEHLRRLFNDTVELAANIFGDIMFRPYVPKVREWAPHPQKAFADAVMVGVSNHLDARYELEKASEQIVEAVKQLFVDHPAGTFTGRGNTKKDVQERITLFSDMLSRFR